MPKFNQSFNKHTIKHFSGTSKKVVQSINLKAVTNNQLKKKIVEDANSDEAHENYQDQKFHESEPNKEFIINSDEAGPEMSVHKQVKPEPHHLNEESEPTQQEIPPKQTGKNNYIVPNYAHFIWYANKPKELQFHHLLSLLSTQKVMKAEKIYLHHNMEPVGPYWEEAKKKIPNLILQHRDPPTSMFGVKLKAPAFETSHSNADRIKVIQEYGGVYLDFDVLITNPLEPLRVYPTTLGELVQVSQTNVALCN
jgi:hypothetical protein